MSTITISEEKFEKVLADVENLITDVNALLNQDEPAKRRLQELRDSPQLAKSEEELDSYLKKRGVQIE